MRPLGPSCLRSILRIWGPLAPAVTSPQGGWQAPWRLCVPFTPRGQAGAGYLARRGTRRARPASAFTLGAAGTRGISAWVRSERLLARLSTVHHAFWYLYFFKQRRCATPTARSCCTAVRIYVAGRAGSPARCRPSGVSSQKRSTARSAAEAAGAYRVPRTGYRFLKYGSGAAVGALPLPLGGLPPTAPRRGREQQFPSHG